MKYKKYYIFYLWSGILSTIFVLIPLGLMSGQYNIVTENLFVFVLFLIPSLLYIGVFIAIILDFYFFYGLKTLFVFALVYLIFSNIIEFSFYPSFFTFVLILLKITFSYKNDPENFQSFFFRNKKTLIKRQELKKDDKSWLDYFRFTHKNDFLMAEKIFLKTPARTLVYLWTGFIIGLALYFLFGENILYTSDVMSKFLTENYQSKEFRLIFNLIVLFFYLYAFFAFYMIFIELAKKLTYIPLIIFLILAIFNIPYFALVFYITAFFQLAMTSLNSFADNDLDNYVYTVKTPESNRDNNDEDN